MKLLPALYTVFSSAAIAVSAVSGFSLLRAEADPTVGSLPAHAERAVDVDVAPACTRAPAPARPPRTEPTKNDAAVPGEATARARARRRAREERSNSSSELHTWAMLGVHPDPE